MVLIFILNLIDVVNFDKAYQKQQQTKPITITNRHIRIVSNIVRLNNSYKRDSCMKFIIYAEIDVQDEKRLGLLKALTPLIEKVRAQTGCIRYDWNMDSSNNGRINVYEEWKGEAALAAHFAGDNFKAMGAKIGKHGVLGTKARKFSIHQEAAVFNAGGAPSVKF